MPDGYLYEDVPVLKNRLGIKKRGLLDAAEAGLSRASMMLLCEEGFQDFSPAGLSEIHRRLFGDIYDWAGEFRVINIKKRERLLAGWSVWYSDQDDILPDLERGFAALLAQPWDTFSREEFVSALAEYFAPIWQVHPFREGNTRSVFMMLSLFVEHHGFFVDYDRLTDWADHARDTFVLASLGQYSEWEHLERLLGDIVCGEPVSS